MRVGLLSAVLFTGLAAPLPGASISFGSDLLNEWNNITATNVAIQPHWVWASLPPYHWISYANTGYGPGAVSVPNAVSASSPTAIFYEQLPAGTSWVQLRVFADDTAAVYLIDLDHPGGLLLAPPNWVQDAYCASGPIGCEPGEGLLLQFPVNSLGTALLRFDVYQRHGGPFGLLYAGEARLAHTPEAGSLILVASGLGWIFWRRSRRSSSGPDVSQQAADCSR